MPHSTHATVAALAALSLLSMASPTSAQAPSSAGTLAEQRERLRTYDLSPEGTTRVIAALGALAAEARGPEALEARFLRTVASADLLLIAQRRRDGALVERVAEAYGVPSLELNRTLRSELGSLRREPYVAIVDDALAALAPSAPREIPPADDEHTRRQAVFFARVLDDVVRADDATDVLARLADDPCTRPDDECPMPFGQFGPRGRRAVAAMTELHTLLASIERTADQGDPFSAALARAVAADAVVLRSITIAPSDWAVGVRPVAVSSRRVSMDADAAIVLGAGRIRAGWIPEVQWDSQGRPAAVADGPLLGGADEDALSITVDAGSFVRPIPVLEAFVSHRIRGASSIALMIEPGVEAHVLWRVLVSLEEADLRPAFLAVAAADGTARGVPFETVHDQLGSVGVFVRLGGFSAWQPGEHVSLPRQRTSENRWEFDFAGLDRATSERARHPLTLRFMGTVGADLVLRVALHLASETRPLRLVVPYVTQEEDES